MIGCAKQHRSADPPLGGRFDLECKTPRAGRGSVQHFGEMATADAQPLGQFGDSLREWVMMPRHVTSVVCDTIKSRGYEIDSMSLSTDAVGMLTWPQRPVFKAAVLAYRKAHNLTPEEMADALCVKPSYLHNLLYDKRVWPSLEIIQKSAEVLGLSITELTDDPGADIAGAPEGASEVDRFILKAMGSNLTKLTDVQKQAAHEAWSAIIRGYVKQ